MFDNIYKLDGVPVATVQLRFDGWVTELNDKDKRNDVASDYSGGKAPGLDNLLYTADAEFSCFADLALTSPSSDYYKPGEVRACVSARPTGVRVPSFMIESAWSGRLDRCYETEDFRWAGGGGVVV